MQSALSLEIHKTSKMPLNDFCSTYFVVHIAGHQRNVDSGVTPWVRLHAVPTLSSQGGC